MSQQALGPRPGLAWGLSNFVGRRREVAEVRRLVAHSRLVTLTGPGGVGKTRVALEVANGARRQFRDGVYFIELEQVGDPGLVADTVAVAVGLREQAGSSPLELLTNYLASRQVLLVLDNSEHVIEAIAELVAALLRACPTLRILATSREWLGVEGEVVTPVPPLSVPDADLPLEEQNPLQYEAVALFVDRATSVVPDFVVSERNRADVVEICRRLDGLPLAIELAAARLGTLSEREMLARLSDHPHLLAARGRSHAPQRQRTLRSCIEWSHSLCSAEEQLLWARLAVFAGGFEMGTAEDVCSGEGIDVADIFDLVTSLADKSILIAERQGDVVRFRMLETIREFGREQLRAIGEQERLRRRHRDYYLDLVEQADAAWVTPRQADWFARLDREHSDVQAAVDYCLTQLGETEVAMRMLTAVFHFYWWGRGWAREGRLWLSRALEQPGPPSEARAHAQLVDGALAYSAARFDIGAERLAEAKRIAESIADPAVTARACWLTGMAAQYAGDLPTSIAESERGLSALEPGRALPLRLDLLLMYAISAGLLGDAASATECHLETLRITEPQQEYFHRSYALWALGLLAMQQGDAARAAQLHTESIRLRRGIRDVTGIAWSLESLAWAECTLGHHERAATMLGTADRLWEVMGRPLEAYQHLLPYHQTCAQTTEERLGEKRYASAFGRGRAMSLEDGMAFALDERRTPDRTQPQSTDGLTAREREIAALIADGLSNRQIASRLTISVRTAETHAQHILLKLGFRSRAQIASWVAQQHATAETARSGSR